MSVLWRAHRAVDRLATWPGFSEFLRRRYERRFESNQTSTLFRGVYASYGEALQSAPTSQPAGYDSTDPAAMYVDRMERTQPRDYPVMFWLQKLLLGNCRRVFDLGGHVGVKYYAYRRYMDYPASLRWCVCDLPAVVAKGRRAASERDREGLLAFSERFEDAEGSEVLLALGSLQYLPETLAERLTCLERPPTQLILNGVPLHERWSFFTLQSTGTAFCPYRITADAAFVASLAALGYALVDRWENPEKSCEIPFHPDRSLDHYHGFYFRRGS